MRASCSVTDFLTDLSSDFKTFCVVFVPLLVVAYESSHIIQWTMSPVSFYWIEKDELDSKVLHQVLSKLSLRVFIAFWAKEGLCE